MTIEELRERTLRAWKNWSTFYPNFSPTIRRLNTWDFILNGRHCLEVKIVGIDGRSMTQVATHYPEESGWHIPAAILLPIGAAFGSLKGGQR